MNLSLALISLVGITLFLGNILLLHIFAIVAKRWHIFIDYPRGRSSHRKATVRGAGLFFVLSSLLAWLMIEMQVETGYIVFLVCGSLLVAGVSFLDDMRSVPVSTRLVIHFLAAAVFLTSVRAPSILVEHMGEWCVLWYPLAAIFITASTNLYNFMDGIDGMASLHGLCVLLGWILLLGVFSGGRSFELLLYLSLAVPLFAFLLFNWQPAKVFMGDVGSTFLGFAFSSLAVVQMGSVPRLVNGIAFIMLMMPFLFDTSFTVISRWMKGKSVHTRHKDFLFHRLVTAGYSHRLVSAVYGVMTLYNVVLLLLVVEGRIGVVFGLPLILTPYLALYSWVFLSIHAPRLSRVRVIE